ncbi:MAG TPA: GNAT family N-acetyltransferase [Propionibacteriaceae bacterium]|nr:GNAT family N-acetyltransferase [Propionibacteriaceae bacterium]
MPTSRSAPVLRYVTEEQGQDYLSALIRVFHGDYKADHWDLDRRIFEWDRCFGFTVDDRWVATTGAFTKTMTVPGGTVPVAAVTVVTVSPAYRRRGLLRQMMTHQLGDVHRRREPVAALWASEAPIYGRFGYGSAIPRLHLRGSTKGTDFLPQVDLGDGWVEEPTREEYAATVPGVHARLLPDRPGGLDRNESWWERRLLDDPDRRSGASGLRYALHRSAGGEVDGYAMYRVKEDWTPEGGTGEVRVTELDAATGPARTALWRYVLDLDLITDVTAHDIPIDEPLRYQLLDPRALRVQVADSIYIRVVDVKAALAARRYAADLDLVVGLRDQMLAHNDGAFRIEAGAEGARVTRSRRRPDLVMDIRELGAGYLGGISFQQLHTAGLLTEQTPGAVAAMTLAFDWFRKPFCNDDF